MNAQRSLQPLPKFFMGFEHTTDALAHCKRFGAHPLIEKREDNLHWPQSFATRDMALAAMAEHGIVNGFAMGLRTGNVTRYAVGIDDAPRTTPRAAPVKRSEDEGDVTAPVATGTRVRGATFKCRELYVDGISKDDFVALMATHDVGASTAGTQWYRLRKK